MSPRRLFKALLKRFAIVLGASIGSWCLAEIGWALFYHYHGLVIERVYWAPEYLGWMQSFARASHHASVVAAMVFMVLPLFMVVVWLISWIVAGLGIFLASDHKGGV